MAKRETRLPALTDVKSLIEALNVRLGRSGDPLDRAVTLRDVVDSGLPVKAVRRHGPNEFSIEYEAPSESRVVPPAPTGVIAQAMFGGVNLLWDQAVRAQDIQYVEIWRSTGLDPTTRQFLTAESGAMYFDVLDEQDTRLYYYWVRYCSISGHTGAFAAPVSAAALPLVSDLLTRLSEALADEPADLGSPGETFVIHADRFALRSGALDDPVYPLVTTLIDGAPAVVMNTALIAEASIQEGQLGAITIGKLEDAYGQPVTTVAGQLRADMIEADSLNVASAATFTGDVISNNYQPGTTGWIIRQNGFVEFNEALIRGNLEVQSITVNGQAPYGGVAVETTSFNWSGGGSVTAAGGGDMHRAESRTETATISEVPQNGVLDVTLNYAARSQASGHRRNIDNYMASGGDGSSYEAHNIIRYAVTYQLRARLRMWVDGELQVDENRYLSGSVNGGDGHAWSKDTGALGGGYTLQYTYPEYRASSTVQVTVDTECHVTHAAEYSSPARQGHVFAETAQASGSLRINNLLASGDISRLG